ncbi:MAG: DUF4202 domain-containing protein [Anaerolineae bacterium]|nr:DUF4202 domain-containing protein [Anaerolineae bacterium]
MSDKLKHAIEKIDAANADDPNLMEDEGQMRPVELVHAERRTDWIYKLVGDDASDELLLAARGQHIRRWEIPRDSYARDRASYLQWRNDLKKFHAEKTTEIMKDVGYDDAAADRVTNLILKKRLKLDPEVQALEDALCLVFLETQFTEFAKQEADKITNILRKTWRKMSPQGQQFALQLPMSEEDLQIVEAALAGE